MLTWYQSKVKYEVEVADKRKMISELYLHEAVNFGEVEQQCYERLKGRIKDPDVDAIGKAPFNEVIFYSGTTDSGYTADPFYKVGVDAGEKYSYLIPACDSKQAIDRALKAHGYGDAHNIFEVKRTDILAVWHPNNELWQGDWWNRMELLLSANKHSPDINQYTMDFGSDTANEAVRNYEETLSSMARDGITVTVEHGGKTIMESKPTKKGIVFHKHNGDPVDA